MSFLSKVKSVAKTATKVVAAPVKVAAKATKVATKVAVAPIKVASKVASLPTKALLKVTPGPLKNIVKIATAPVNLVNKAATKVAIKAVSAPAKVTAKVAAAPAAIMKKVVAAASPARAVAAPAKKLPIVAAKAPVRGVMPAAPKAPMGPMATMMPMVAKVMQAASPSSVVAIAPAPAAPAAQYIPPPSRGASPASSYDDEDAGDDSNEPYGSDEDGEIYDSGPVGPPVENDFTLSPDDSNLPEVEGETMPEENDPDDIADIDYAAVFAGLGEDDDSAANYGMGDWKADLKKVGSSVAVGAAKDAASTGLSLVAAKLAQAGGANSYIPPAPTGMTMPVKVAIGVAVAVPLLYLATQHGKRA